MPVKNKKNLGKIFLVVGLLIVLYFGVVFAIVNQSPEYDNLLIVEKIAEAAKGSVLFKHSPFRIFNLEDSTKALKNVGSYLLGYALLVAIFRSVADINSVLLFVLLQIRCERSRFRLHVSLNHT